MGSEVRAASPHANSPMYGIALYLRVYCAGGMFLREKVSKGDALKQDTAGSNSDSRTL